jgi:hypothetical protein
VGASSRRLRAVREARRTRSPASSSTGSQAVGYGTTRRDQLPDRPHHEPGNRACVLWENAYALDDVDRQGHLGDQVRRPKTMDLGPSDLVGRERIPSAPVTVNAGEGRCMC